MPRKSLPNEVYFGPVISSPLYSSCDSTRNAIGITVPVQHLFQHFAMQNWAESRSPSCQTCKKRVPLWHEHCHPAENKSLFLQSLLRALA
uniref:Phorbol-ester/DAG-type domain-containing protein n=1 Tax=Steinernema glaseri TaxID=37863 RepID=A0A1I7ZAQ5_9BILA